MQNSHTEVWDQTCNMGMFCDSGLGFGEKRLLKYSDISLQLGPLSPTFPRDTELSWTLLLHTPALAHSMWPICRGNGVSLAALTAPQVESHCLVVIQACRKSLAFLQAWLVTRWLILCLSQSCCVPKWHGGPNGNVAFSSDIASHLNSIGCRWCTIRRSKVLGRTCFGLSPAKWSTWNPKAPLQTQEIYGLF